MCARIVVLWGRRCADRLYARAHRTRVRFRPMRVTILRAGGLRRVQAGARAPRRCAALAGAPLRASFGDAAVTRQHCSACAFASCAGPNSARARLPPHCTLRIRKPQSRGRVRKPRRGFPGPPLRSGSGWPLRASPFRAKRERIIPEAERRDNRREFRF